MTNEKKNDQFIKAEVITVSGSFPDEGSTDVPIHQKIRILLEKASAALGIINTDGFIATINGQEIDINATYESLGLSDITAIDWSKREGGGGYA